MTRRLTWALEEKGVRREAREKKQSTERRAGKKKV